MKKIFFLLGVLIFSGFLVTTAQADNQLDKKMVLAEWISRNSSTTPTSTTATLNLSCVQAAVTTRETAVIAAYSTMSTGISTALTTRQTELTAAWGLTDNKARRNARKVAWDKFNKSVKEIRKTYKNSVNATWKKFHTDSKACKVNTQGVESVSSDLSL